MSTECVDWGTECDKKSTELDDAERTFKLDINLGGLLQKFGYSLYVSVRASLPEWGDHGEMWRVRRSGGVGGTKQAGACGGWACGRRRRWRVTREMSSKNFERRPGATASSHIRHCAHSEKIGLDNRALIISPDMAGEVVRLAPSSDSPAQPTASRPFSAPGPRPPVPTLVIADVVSAHATHPGHPLSRPPRTTHRKYSRHHKLSYRLCN